MPSCKIEYRDTYGSVVGFAEVTLSGEPEGEIIARMANDLRRSAPEDACYVVLFDEGDKNASHLVKL